MHPSAGVVVPALPTCTEECWIMEDLFHQRPGFGLGIEAGSSPGHDPLRSGRVWGEPLCRVDQDGDLSVPGSDQSHELLCGAGRVTGGGGMVWGHGRGVSGALEDGEKMVQGSDRIR